MRLRSRLDALEVVTRHEKDAQDSSSTRARPPITPRVLRAIRDAQRRGKHLSPEVEAEVRRLEEHYGMTEDGEWQD